MNSLVNKLHYLHGMILINKLQIISITETWLLNSIPSSFVTLPGFELYRGDVGGEVRKHGAALYVDVSFRQVQVEVQLPNLVIVFLLDLDIYVLSVYRPPSYSVAENEALREFLTEFSLGKEVVIMGDFNLPSLKWDDRMGMGGQVSGTDRSFFDCFVACGFSQWVESSTFFPSGNILDLVLTSEIDRIGSVTVEPPLPGCGHCPVLCSVVFQFGTGPTNVVSQECLSWTKAKYNEISREIGLIEWEFIFEGTSVEEAYGIFVEVINGLVIRYVPVKNKSDGSQWLAVPPRELIRERSICWNNYKNARRRFGRGHTHSLAALDAFNRINYLYRNYARHKQCEYERKVAGLLKEAPKVFNSYIRKRKKGCPTVGPLKSANGSVVTTGIEQSNIFAQAFSSVYVSTVPEDPQPFQSFNGNMEILDANYDAVVSILKALDGSSSPGPDGIHPMLLKNCAEEISLPLTLLFKKSLLLCQLPNHWKVSRVVPIFKGGTKCNPLNYRPVSLTSTCCKVLERVIYAHIVDYLDENNLLSPKQFGFRKRRSTEDQLLLTYADVIKQVDGGHAVDLIFLDFSKAFDVVNHTVLIDKLAALGFSAQMLEWIQSFLVGRSMLVSVGGFDSESYSVLSGVPQGSVLGPLLFLIYVNNLANSLQCKWYAFADDFKLYISYNKNSGLEGVSALQRDLDSLVTVSESWNLKLNYSKCVVMKFGVRTAARDVRSGYFLGDTELSQVQSHRDLGVIVDPSLRFHDHVNDIVRKSSGLSNGLLRSTVCRSRDFMLSVFISHIRPLLDYCSTVWNMGFLGDCRKLESVQRRWTKEVLGLEEMDYNSRLRDLGLYSVYGRMLRCDLLKLWKVFHAEVDVGLADIFERHSHASTRGHRFKLSVPRCRTEIRRRFLNVRSVDVWNGLPAGAVELDTLGRFKTCIDGNLIEIFYRTVDG